MRPNRAMTSVLASACWIVLNCGCARSEDADKSLEAKYAAQRERMVQQIVAYGVSDKLVLQAMRKVERHKFVPAHIRGRAYDDSPLPIGEEQTISQPYIVAFMTAQMGLKGGEKVLEIGTGSGYQAAILAEIVKEVYTIEIVAVLGKRAEALLTELGYKNIRVKVGDGYKGWPEHAPFDAVIVTCAPDHIPQPLIDQLRVGGRIIIPVGEQWLGQELVLVTKTEKGIHKRSVLPVRFVPMTGEAQKGR